MFAPHWNRVTNFKNVSNAEDNERYSTFVEALYTAVIGYARFPTLNSDTGTEFCSTLVLTSAPSTMHQLVPNFNLLSYQISTVHDPCTTHSLAIQLQQCYDALHGGIFCGSLPAQIYDRIKNVIDKYNHSVPIQQQQKVERKPDYSFFAPRRATKRSKIENTADAGPSITNKHIDCLLGVHRAETVEQMIKFYQTNHLDTLVAFVHQSPSSCS